eukprot:Blabericola_migrator_1__7130@NODE_360_length_9432_cov_135_447517_g288_i0_p6_GENE_NODE_360_length_9432_cov_135_447517_g288_i0NODE_360_length_9432_cov_135_447517_g288_i0_p6_ORF_typecomplete_len145_score20_76Bap31/PF05529_12/2e06PepSY_TM/PF03929_16/2_6e02PepSY_TM/PF03929_16/3_5_NODE_360_length_9432_cov_135_447517_g288_i075509
MQTFFWSFMTYGVLVSGLIVTVLIFSGVQLFERLGAAICNLGLGVGGRRKAESIYLRLPLFFLTISTTSLGYENWALQNLMKERNALNSTVGLSEIRAKVLRHQRNWWISIAASTVWLIVWRFTGMVRRYRTEISNLKAAQKAH